MIIENAKYRTKNSPNGKELWRCIEVTIDGVEMTVPLDDDNEQYKEIMRQVETGEVSIAPAD